MKRLKKRKIIWAIDPYGEARVQSTAAALARSLSQDCEIEVVYLHGCSGFPIEDEKSAIRFGLAGAEKRLNQILTDLKFKPQKRPKILAHGSEYIRGAVRILVSYATKVRADAILVSTNAKAGFIRHVLGSFSESLILESDIPVMIVNPKANVSSKIGTILFPTDFSEISWEAFQSIVGFAKIVGAKIKIFHQYQGDLQKIPRNVLYFKNDHLLKRDDLLDVNMQKVKVSLSKWLSWSKRQNVECDYTIQFGVKNPAKAIVEYAQKNSNWMIAMATATGPVAATFIGSNARWVVRSATTPVWVFYVDND